MENANLTVNTWYDGAKFEGTVSAPAGTTSTTSLVLPSVLGKPSTCKINGVEVEEGEGWNWNSQANTLTFTVEHQSNAVLTAEWVTSQPSTSWDDTYLILDAWIPIIITFAMLSLFLQLIKKFST